MKEQTSKTLLFVESLLFLGPVSLLTVLYALFLIPMYGTGLEKEPLQAQVAPVFTLLGLGIQACGWRMIFAFLTGGRAALRRVPQFYVYATSAGAVLAALAGLVVLLLTLEVELPAALGLLTANFLAIPALVPFVHTMVERRMSSRADIGNAI